MPNVRDLANLRGPDQDWVRAGMLFRGPAPVIASSDLSRLRLRTVIDLRTPTERSLAPLAGGATTILTLVRPMHADAPWLARGQRPVPSQYLANYRELLPQAGTVVVEMLELLAAGGATPVLVCCSAGKDRTGVVCALLLRALGVKLADICRDYALTARILRRVGPDDAGTWSAGLSPAEFAPRVETLAATMRKLLAGVEGNHGQTLGYLGRFGLTARVAAQARLRLMVSQPTRYERNQG